MDWIHLSVERSRWLAVMDEAVNSPVTFSAENLLNGCSGNS